MLWLEKPLFQWCAIIIETLDAQEHYGGHYSNSHSPDVYAVYRYMHKSKMRLIIQQYRLTLCNGCNYVLHQYFFQKKIHLKLNRLIHWIKIDLVRHPDEGRVEIKSWDMSYLYFSNLNLVPGLVVDEVITILIFYYCKNHAHS